MTGPDVRLRIFAPRGVVGGIATWAAEWSRCMDPNFEVCWLDTAMTYDDIGSDLKLIPRLTGGSRAARQRLVAVKGLLREAADKDVVYLTVSPNAGLWVRDFPILLKLRRAGVRTIVHLHGGDVRAFFGWGPISRRVARWCFGGVSRIVCITPDVLHAARQIVGNRAVGIPNMLGQVEASEVTNRRRALQVLGVGGQTRKKGTLEFIQVARGLPHVQFALIGPLSTEVEEALQAAEAAGMDNIAVLGVLDHEAVLDHMSSAAVLLFPSHGEGFPMAVLEAMASGMGIVATDVGAIPEMLGGPGSPAGIVVKRDGEHLVGELTDAVRELVEHPELRDALGAAARSRAETRYTSAVVSGALNDLVRSVAAEPSAGGPS